MGGNTTTIDPQPSQVPVSSPLGRRRWAFRLAAIALGLMPLVAFEGLCAVMDWGRPSLHDDPFVGFRDVKPLFVTSEDGTRMVIPKPRQVYFCADSFAVPKSADEFRVFCLGGSTVQGSPFHIQTAFSTWLELSLAAAEPDRTWRVINCGGVSYASYRLVPILEEVLDYQPDLIILYTGHNEFLEARSFEHVAERGKLVNASLEAASQLRTFTLLREGYLRMQGISSQDPPRGRPILPTEVETLLDYRGGLEEYHHDEPSRQGVVDHYAYNLQRMVQLAREHGVPVMLVNPAYNLSDCPPFKSEHDPQLASEKVAEWESLIESAHDHLRREHYDPYQALAEFRLATELDPMHAGGFYSLAQCCLSLEKYDEAKVAFDQAKELDVCPLRIVQVMNDVVCELAEEADVPLLDAQALFEQRSSHGITGGDWFVDHVHPKFEGHQLIADALADMLVEQGLVQPDDDWQTRRREAYAAHFDSLSPHYFEQGMQRLKAQTEWAQGRARQLRPGATAGPDSDVLDAK